MDTVWVPGRHYKWVVLGVGMFAQASTSTFFQGLASIGPVLRRSEGLSLAQLGLLLGAPMAGFVVTLLPWGMASDRFTERPVMALGLGLTGAMLLLTSLVSGLGALWVCLALAGAAGASVNAASGRAVLGWFARDRRGVAMGLRQTSVPLGAAFSAVLLPVVASAFGIAPGFRVLAVICLLGALASWLWVREPPESIQQTAVPAPVTEPDRQAHRRAFVNVVLASTCLVVCQTIFVAFVVEMLHGHREMSLRGASLVFAVAQVSGAVSRVVVGGWSDRMPDRLAPLRILSFAMAGGALLLGVLFEAPLPVVVVLSVAVGTLVICWNGLAFTAAGEMASPGRTGTALGLQSTANFFVASVTPFLAGSLIAWAGFRLGFAFIAVPATIAGVLLLSSRPARRHPTDDAKTPEECSR